MDCIIPPSDEGEPGVAICGLLRSMRMGSKRREKAAYMIPNMPFSQ